MIYTLEDYSRDVLRPMALKYIRTGKVDDVIFDPFLDELYSDDKELMDAVKYRRALLKQKK